MDGTDQIVLIQISDIHICEVIENQDFSGNEGYWGHTPDLTAALREAIEDARVRLLQLPPEVPVYVVMSGDLTSRGHAEEFPIAHSYLMSHWVRDASGLLCAGLDLEPDRILAVPGNHDHWNGFEGPRRFWLLKPWNYLKRWPPAYTPSIFRGGFIRTPWVRPIQDPRGELLLEVYGIDSNAGLATKATNLRAQGRYSVAEIRKLGRLLNASHKKPLATGTRRKIRVLVSHHGIYPNSQFKWYQSARPLDAASRRALMILANRRPIKVMLTGHFHEIAHFGHTLALGSTAHTLNEVRAPSATQGLPAMGKQGFLVHQVRFASPQDSTVRWTVYLYHWHQGQFVTGPRSAPVYNFLI
jgi:3',5'-cyclic AMP phosphodiesterase CpdA